MAKASKLGLKVAVPTALLASAATFPFPAHAAGAMFKRLHAEVNSQLSNAYMKSIVQASSS